MMVSIRALIAAWFGLCFHSVASETPRRAIIPETCGQSFVFAFPAVIGVPDDDAYVMITSYSSVPTNVTVAVPGIFATTSMVSVDTFVNITLPRNVILEKDDVVVNKSVLITAEEDVCVYGICAGTGAGDAFNALPISVLSQRYVLSSFKPVNSETHNHPSELVVTALEKETTVVITLARDEVIEQILRPYESFQYRDFDYDLTGTLITSNKPISVMSGHECAEVPSGTPACDILMTHMPGTDGLGRHFVLTPFSDRTSGYVFRVLAVRNDTNVAISDGTTAQLSEFEFYEGDISTANTITIISTTNDVFVTQFAKGFGSDGRTGDPFMLLIPPTNFYANNVTFPVTSIPVFVGTNQQSHINVIIRCDDVPGISLNRQQEPDWDDSLSDEAREYCVLRKPMAPGLHSVGHSSREVKFAVLVYGFALSGSYAYFAGYNFQEVDTTNPIISGLPESISVETDPSSPTATVTWEDPTTSDNSGLSVTVTSTHSPGDSFPIGNTSVTYTAVDSSGNEVSVTFTVTVLDNEKPVIDGLPGIIAVNTDPGSPNATVSWDKPSATDNSGQPVTVTSAYSPGDFFPIGNTSVTYTVMDASGNEVYGSFTITVKDNEKPIIDGLPESIVVNTDAGLPNATVSWKEPRASDNSGEPVTLTSTHSLDESFPVGNTTVTYTAVDSSGNEDSAAFIVTVIDNEKPVISGLPELLEVNTDPGSPTATVTWEEPTAIDNSGEPVTLTSTHGPGDTFSIGDTSVSYTGVDRSGNIRVMNFTITVTAVCLEGRVSMSMGNFSWNMSLTDNQAVDSLEKCSNQTLRDGRGKAVRICEFDESNGARWLDAQYVGCGDVETSLEHVAEIHVIDDNVGYVAESLNNVTARLVNLTRQDIMDIGDILRSIVEVGSSNPQVTTQVVNIVNNLVSATTDTYSTGYEEDGDSSSAETNVQQLLDILVDLEEQIQRATESGQSIEPVVQPEIVFTTVSVPPGTESRFVIRNSEDTGGGFSEGDVEIDQGTAADDVRTSITLPPSLFNDANGTFQVSFVVHRTDTLFPSNSTNQTRIVGGDIIAAIVSGETEVTDLQDPVVLEITAIGENPSCVFWDFDIQDWSQEGCQLHPSSSTSDKDKLRVICHCNHLTNFAVLMDFDQSQETWEYQSLDIISKIGCIASILGLVLTIAIFLTFRRLIKGTGARATSRKILIQFSLSLCLLYLMFLAGIDQTQNRIGCISVAVSLQYLTLSCLMWMAVEAQNMYINVVRIFDGQPQHFWVKASIVAWGVPLVITGISFGTGFSSYDHLKYCYVTSKPLYFGVLLPLAIMLLHNIVIFALIIRVLWKAKVGAGNMMSSKAFSTSRRLKNAFALSVLLGLTWMLGFFAIEDADFIFSLLFCLCNSFQGLVVFILFCLRQDDVQLCLRPYIIRLCWCLPEGALRRLSSTIATNLPSVRLSRASQSTRMSHGNGTDFSVKMFKNVNSGFESDDTCDSDRSMDVDSAVRETEESDAGDLDDSIGVPYADSPVTDRKIKMSPLALGSSNENTTGSKNLENQLQGAGDDDGGSKNRSTSLTYHFQMPSDGYVGHTDEQKNLPASEEEDGDSNIQQAQDKSAIVDELFPNQKLNDAVKGMLSGGNPVSPPNDVATIDNSTYKEDPMEPSSSFEIPNPGEDAEDEDSDDSDVLVAPAVITKRASVLNDAVVEVDSD